MYRHAMWGPSPAWNHGLVWGASVAQFKAGFPQKVRELGLPLLVWDSDNEKADAGP